MAADKKDTTGESVAYWQPVKLNEVSSSAYMRLLALHLEEEEAAIVMARKDSYADFFLESPTQQFHEYFGPWDRDLRGIEVRLSRMAIIDRLKDPVMDKYPDFFVDSPRNGPPFHEKFLDKGPPKDEWFGDAAARVQAMRQSRVLQAFLRVQERVLDKKGR